MKRYGGVLFTIALFGLLLFGGCKKEGEHNENVEEKKVEEGKKDGDTNGGHVPLPEEFVGAWVREDRVESYNTHMRITKTSLDFSNQPVKGGGYGIPYTYEKGLFRYPFFGPLPPEKEVRPLVDIKVWLSNGKLHVLVQEGSLLAAGDKILRILTLRLPKLKGEDLTEAEDLIQMITRLKNSREEIDFVCSETVYERYKEY